MLTPKGNNSAKHPGLKMTWKRALKIERIARLSADPAGYSNEQIANHLGCDKQTVVLIRQLPEYHAKMIEVMSGVTSGYDLDLRTNSENAREELKSMVPSAMMVIRNSLLSKNENIRMKAAMEVMDREGTLAKVSKTSVAVTTIPAMERDAEVTSNLMALLKGAGPSDGFSDVDITTGGFTTTANQAARQEFEMGQENTAEMLEHLELHNKKPN